jgi:hypothetical protein
VAGAVLGIGKDLAKHAKGDSPGPT